MLRSSDLCSILYGRKERVHYGALHSCGDFLQVACCRV